MGYLSTDSSICFFFFSGTTFNQPQLRMASGGAANPHKVIKVSIIPGEIAKQTVSFLGFLTPQKSVMQVYVMIINLNCLAAHGLID